LHSAAVIIQTHFTVSSMILSSSLPSVCVSVSQMRGLWQNKRNLCPHSYTTWETVHPSFPTRKMVGGGWPLLRKILGQTDPVPSKTEMPACQNEKERSILVRPKGLKQARRA